MILSKKDRISIFILVLVFTLSVLRISFIDYPRYEELRQQHVFTVAEITKCGYIGGSVVQQVEYTFAVSGELYITKIGVFPEKLVKGQKFMVAFNPLKPQLNYLLISHPLDSSFVLGQGIAEDEVGDYEISFWDLSTGQKVE